MHEPRPFGRAWYGAEPTHRDRALIDNRARQLTNLMELSGVDSLRMTFALPDGGHAVVQNMGGVFRAWAFKEAEDDEDADRYEDALGKAYVPTLFSGVVTDAMPRDGAGVEVRLTQQCRARLSSYNDPSSVPERMRLQRFRVDYHDKVQEFKPETAGRAFHTQYTQQRPTWYSGGMAQVMQIVGGIGASDVANPANHWDASTQMELPQEVMRAIEKELEGLPPLPGFAGRPPKDGKFQFDYKFESTDGVAFASDGLPWLVNVSRTGAVAMPLPIVPATRTRAFRQYVQDVGDDELLAILDRFGGMPSGEGFPMSKDRKHWEKAGAIIRLGDTGDFYQHLAYGMAMGWSFNDRGTAAVNSAYDYDSNGYGMSYAYRLGINIGKTQPPPSEDLLNAEAQSIASYKAWLSPALTGADARTAAIRFKLSRAPANVLFHRAHILVRDREAELSFWEDYEAAPMASGRSDLSSLHEGHAYSRLPPMGHPQFKVPDPFMGYCASHSFLPEREAGPSGGPRCDAIIFASYIGNDLHTVKFFHDGRGFYREVQSDFEPCMTVGSWYQRETVGDSRIDPPHFYTSDFDDRQERAGSVKETWITGSDLGYSLTPRFAFDAFFDMQGTLSRSRFIARKTKTKSVSDISAASAICVPYLSRNAVLYAYRESDGVTQESESLSRESVQDPTTYRFWTYDFVMHWVSGPVQPAAGQPYPKDGSPVWVESKQYNPGGCSDFADQGPWLPGLPHDITWLVHPNAKEWKHSGGGDPPPLSAYSRSSTTEPQSRGRVQIRVLGMGTTVHKELPHNHYFLASPDPETGLTFYRDISQVCFGRMEYANTSEQVNGRRGSWGYTRMADGNSAHHFIGVINE